MDMVSISVFMSWRICWHGMVFPMSSSASGWQHSSPYRRAGPELTAVALRRRRRRRATASAGLHTAIEAGHSPGRVKTTLWPVITSLLECQRRKGTPPAWVSVSPTHVQASSRGSGFLMKIEGSWKPVPSPRSNGGKNKENSILRWWASNNIEKQNMPSCPLPRKHPSSHKDDLCLTNRNTSSKDATR